MSFKARMGINIRQELQADSLDERTRNLLYNILIRNAPLIPRDYGILEFSVSSSEEIAELTGTTLEPNCVYNKDMISIICTDMSWDTIYGFIELIYSNGGLRLRFSNFIEKINKIMGEEKCAYRLGQDGLFIRVSSEEEFQSIEQSQTLAKGSVQVHFQKALEGYSRRGNNNYDEVCNEAIKAVEALARQFLDNTFENKTLGQCLDPLRQKLSLPSFVIEPIRKIWAASNNGEFATRHAKKEGIESVIGEPEAYYILIICSSFINYIYKCKQ